MIHNKDEKRKMDQKNTWDSRGILLIFFMALINIFLSDAHAQNRNVESHFLYKINQGDVSVRSPWYESPQDAYAAYQNWFAKQPDGTNIVLPQDSPPFVVLLDLFPATGANNVIYNGKPTEFWWHFARTDGQATSGWNSSISTNTTDCPTGTSYHEDIIVEASQYKAYCISPNRPQPDCDICNNRAPLPVIGNPILPSTAVKQQIEVDYQGGGQNSLRFVRTYRSDRGGWISNLQSFGIDFTMADPKGIWPGNACVPGVGQNTNTPYCFKYIGTGSQYDFSLQRGNGRLVNFGSSTDLFPSLDVNDRVSAVFDINGIKIGNNVSNSQNDSIEFYDPQGFLKRINFRNGQTQSFIYSDENTDPSIAPRAGLLISVSDSFGRSITFTYNASSRMSAMTDPEGNLFHYAYDETSSVVGPNESIGGNLTSVIYPDGQKRVYWYNEKDKTGGNSLPFALTGITDENGVRFATYYYDSLGRAISTEHAGAVEKSSLRFNYANQTDVTDPLGTTRYYSFETILGVVKSTGLMQPSNAGVGYVSTSVTYDANSNVATSTDFNGVKTSYSYDLTRNLETSRTEAVGTAQARTITTTWHPTYRLPLQIAEPKRLTTFTYDALGNLLTKTLQATTDANGTQGLSAALTGKPRIWSYTYNAVGQVFTATGPRTDVNDTTTYSYDSSGNLATVTNAAGHTTTLSGYDANGRVGTIIAPNGDTTNLTYTPRGWLSSKTVVASGVSEATSYSYDGVGQLTQVTLPDNSTISYVYDDAHRLTSVSDSLGNSIVYTLDLMGNRISEQVKDTSGLLARQTSRVFDALNNLQQQTGGVQ